MERQSPNHRRAIQHLICRSQATEGSTGSDETARLRVENVELRAVLLASLNRLSKESRAAFSERHEQLRAQGSALGEKLPQITREGVLDVVQEAVRSTEASTAAQSPAEEESAAEESAAPAAAPEQVSAPSEGAKKGWQLSPEGDAAILHGEDDTVTFSFGALAESIKNDLSAQAIGGNGGPSRADHGPRLYARPQAAQLPRSSLSSAGKGPFTQRVSSRRQAVSSERADRESSTGPASKANTAIAEEPENGKISYHTETPGDPETKEELVETEYGGGQDTEPLRPSSAGLAEIAARGRDQLQELQGSAEPSAAGRGESNGAPQAADTSVAELVVGREQWLYFVNPEQPVAGQRATIYFNNNVSDILREKMRRVVHAKFNYWELEGEGGAWLEMEPAGAPHEGGADWWQVEVAVPTDAFEMNYVFTDGEGATDNNQGKNYMTPVQGAMTSELWEEKAVERLVAAEKKRKAEERTARARAEEERRAAEDAEDQSAAQQRAKELRNNVAFHREGALSSLQRDGKLAWYSEPKEPMPGQKIKLFYNAQSGSLAHMTPLPSPPTVVLGFNGWIDTQEVTMRSATGVREPGDWFTAEADVPADVAVLNFVVQYFEHFDNNYGLDYKAAVQFDSHGSSLDDFEARKADEIYQSLRQRRRQQREEWQRRERRRAELRGTAKAKALAVLRRQTRHVLFTEPSEPQAGQDMTVYYNPSNTCLAGCSDIFITGGFNRWTHREKFGPLRMTPAEGEGSHCSATVSVPRTAHSVDFVLSDVPEGEGTYDNRGGLDYYLPVEGSEVEPPGLHVVHVAVEMAPICKVGGLGDVVTALGRAVQEQGHMVEVILPRYDFFLQSPLLGATRLETEFDWGGTHIWVSTCVVESLRCFFIEPANGFFAVDAVYGRSDDAMRFDFFSKAALEFLLQTGRQPDVLHCHDWSTASLAQAYWSEYHHYGLWRPRVVFTIHNAEFGLDRIGAAAHHCQRFTTVSPSYASEIGANPAIAAHAGKFMGIRNGIDLDIWDPENDSLLPLPYSASNVVEGKKAAREALRYRLGLTGWGDKPLVGVVTRVTEQKGLHLIRHAAWRTLERGGQFVLLGSAPDPKIQAQFTALAATLGGENAHFAFFYDESLSHLIYAGCDLIAVPSMFEPCGLTQLIAMRYGSVPVVRATGGLRDTVFDVGCDKARAAWEMEGSSDWERDGLDATNGFSFEGTNAESLDYALNRALDAYYDDRAWFNSLAARIMRQDWSWNRPALDYVELYWQAMK